MSTTTSSVIITPCTSPSDIVAAAALFIACVTWLDMDLSFQDFAGELASLPGKYARNRGGCLLLAKDVASGEALGVVALRGSEDPLRNSGACEMKRLYVTPAGRGRGVGRKLVEALIIEAKRLGYRRMLLDTLSRMEHARGLCKALGFKSCERYYENPYT